MLHCSFDSKREICVPERSGAYRSRGSRGIVTSCEIFEEGDTRHNRCETWSTLHSTWPVWEVIILPHRHVADDISGGGDTNKKKRWSVVVSAAPVLSLSTTL